MQEYNSVGVAPIIRSINSGYTAYLLRRYTLKFKTTPHNKTLSLAGNGL